MDTHDRPPGTVIALTADDDRFTQVRRSAIELAAREGASLLLYDWDAPMLLGDPLPSIWSADGTDTAVPDRLDAAALEAAGRSAIARQVRDGTRVGVETSAWLPSVRGAEALLRYALDHDAIAVVVPADLDDLEKLQVAESAGTGPRVVTA
jgi:hypothetical protein